MVAAAEAFNDSARPAMGMVTRWHWAIVSWERPLPSLPMNTAQGPWEKSTSVTGKAALSGTVTVSQYNSSYGYYVMIDHGNGLSTLYGHNSQLLAQVGQTVEAGDIISLSGSTGRSTGPHLHFEVRVNGERTNPRAYLPPSE